MSGVTIVLDEVSPLLERLKTAAERAGLSLEMARGVAGLVRGHLGDLNTERSKHGSNFYGHAARSVGHRMTPKGAVVGITKVGIRQRLFGGQIKPKAPRKYLTIPEAPEAYGKRASNFPDLDFGMGLDGNGNLRPALIRRASTAIKFIRRKRRDGSIKTTVKATEVRGGEVFYWLVRSVNQRPDPTVLPAQILMVDAALDAARRRVNRLTSRNAPGGPNA